MKFSSLATSAAVVLVGVLVAVEASGYPRPYGSQQQQASGSRYNCRGYHCGQPAAAAGYGTGAVSAGYSHRPVASLKIGYGAPQGGRESAYGPYHSYRVRPAVYGGHKLYTYRGYARHPPAFQYKVPRANYNKPRAYKPKQQHSHHQSPALVAYGLPLKPVQVVALAPANYGRGYGSSRNSHGYSQYSHAAASSYQAASGGY